MDRDKERQVAPQREADSEKQRQAERETDRTSSSTIIKVI